jgi:hypothetical protein
VLLRDLLESGQLIGDAVPDQDAVDTAPDRAAEG